MTTKNKPIVICNVPVELVDQFCAVDVQMKVLEDQKSLLHKLIAAAIPPEFLSQNAVAYVLPGSESNISVSVVPVKQSLKEGVAVAKVLFKLLGKARFLQLAKLSLKDVAPFLDDEQLAELVVTEEGSRRFGVRHKATNSCQISENVDESWFHQ